MDYLYLASACAIFVAVALLVEALYILWNSKYGVQAQRISRRLRNMSAHAGQSPKEALLQKRRVLSDTPGLHRLLGKLSLVNSFDRFLAQSGSQLTFARFCLISLAMAGAALAGLMLAGFPSVLAVAAALAAGATPLVCAMRKKSKRLTLLEQQLPEALELMSRAIRAGHALPSAIKMVADEIPEPLGGEFRLVFNEVNYGVPMQDALKNLSLRVPGSDIGFFVVAVLIQRETGGNLTDLLDTIAKIVRDRLNLYAQVQVFSAEGRLSAWILGLLPFGLAAVLYLINPGFMQTLWVDPSGIKLLGAMVVLMAAGILWMRSVIRIRV